MPNGQERNGTLEHIKTEIIGILEEKYQDSQQERDDIIEKFKTDWNAASQLYSKAPGGQEAHLHAAKTARIMADWSIDTLLRACLFHQVTKCYLANNIAIRSLLDKMAEDSGYEYQASQYALTNTDFQFMTRIDQIRADLEHVYRPSRWSDAKQKIYGLRDNIEANLTPMLVLMASRLERLRNKPFKKREDEMDFARKTFMVFVPLAHLLRFGCVAAELEDHAFRRALPEEYNRIERLLPKPRIELAEQLTTLAKTLVLSCGQDGQLEGKIDQISCRLKNSYSIFTHLVADFKGGLPVDDSLLKDYLSGSDAVDKVDKGSGIDDLLGLRVVVADEQFCEAAFVWCLNTLNESTEFREHRDSLTGRQSQEYGTINVKLKDRRERFCLEVQILDRGRYYLAEMGEKTAHHKYKFGKVPPLLSDDKFEADVWNLWFPAFDRLFDQQVYLLTREGAVVSLERESTVVDFASHLGLFDEGNFGVKGTRLVKPCDSSGIPKPNRYVEITDKLLTFEQIHIVNTKKRINADLDLLACAVEHATRMKIIDSLERSPIWKQRLNTYTKDILEGEIRSQQTFWRDSGLMPDADRTFQRLAESKGVPLDEIDEILKDITGSPKNEIFDAILHHGQREARNFLKKLHSYWTAYYLRLYDTYRRAKEAAASKYYARKGNVFGPSEIHDLKDIFVPEDAAQVKGLAGFVLAKCCCPIYNDTIVAYRRNIQKGKGIQIAVVHRSDCSTTSKYHRKQIKLSWEENISEERGIVTKYPVGIDVLVFDRPGIFYEVAGVFSSKHINIEDFNGWRLDLWTNVDDWAVSIIELGVYLNSVSEYCSLRDEIVAKEGVIKVERQPYPPAYYSEWHKRKKGSSETDLG